MIRVGLNGFGRIGRAVFRIASAQEGLEIVAVNDLDPNVDNHAYLLKYDSTYGRFQRDVDFDAEERWISLSGRRIPFHAMDTVDMVPWGQHGVDVVIDATGVPHNVGSARLLIDTGTVRTVLITNAARSGVDHTVIFGVNEDTYDPVVHRVVSTSICDVNATGPVLRCLEDRYGVEHGFITTLHPWLSYQNVLDGSARSVSSPGHAWNDFTLGRASPHNLLPKNTTLLSALRSVLPDLCDRLDAISFRVPTSIVSAADLTLTLRTPTSAEELNELFQGLAVSRKRFMGFEQQPLVSMDFLATEQSLFVDGRWTRCLGGKMIKLVLWYDNEWGYSHRVLDVVRLSRQAASPRRTTRAATAKAR